MQTWLLTCATSTRTSRSIVVQGAMDAGNLLKPMLGRGELRCIGATTLDEYRKYIEKDPALERRFQQVRLFCTVGSVEGRAQGLAILAGSMAEALTDHVAMPLHFLCEKHTTLLW